MKLKRISKQDKYDSTDKDVEMLDQIDRSNPLQQECSWPDTLEIKQCSPIKEEGKSDASKNHDEFCSSEGYNIFQAILTVDNGLPECFRTSEILPGEPKIPRKEIRENTSRSVYRRIHKHESDYKLNNLKFNTAAKGGFAKNSNYFQRRPKRQHHDHRRKHHRRHYRNTKRYEERAKSRRSSKSRNKSALEEENSKKSSQDCISSIFEDRCKIRGPPSSIKLLREYMEECTPDKQLKQMCDCKNNPKYDTICEYCNNEDFEGSMIGKIDEDMFDDSPVQTPRQEFVFLTFDNLQPEDIENRYSPGGIES
ncbi:unnamed protein product [Moneuplotes crassus]|uniref:Uncharacterized protein n=1 Tax=Euplotes crassus TaxID=5936 RepID=A0AAD1UHM3_EUPCR|nr:unnamed protein product [Moneuplotes crassus]